MDIQQWIDENAPTKKMFGNGNFTSIKEAIANVVFMTDKSQDKALDIFIRPIVDISMLMELVKDDAYMDNYISETNREIVHPRDKINKDTFKVQLLNKYKEYYKEAIQEAINFSFYTN